jgi:hypothetical protein
MNITLGALVGNNSLPGLFLLGLLAGLLTFGGAYTAIPFVQQDAVIRGQWLTSIQFLDGIAIATILPGNFRLLFAHNLTILLFSTTRNLFDFCWICGRWVSWCNLNDCRNVPSCIFFHVNWS